MLFSEAIEEAETIPMVETAEVDRLLTIVAGIVGRLLDSTDLDPRTGPDDNGHDRARRGQV